MAVSATIPVTQDYREAILASGEADDISAICLTPTYLFGVTNHSPAKLVRLNRDNFAIRTVITFANDDEHKNGVDVIYMASRQRIYVLFANGPPNVLMISEVNPSTMETVDFVREELYYGWLGSLATDGTFLYSTCRAAASLVTSLAKVTLSPPAITITALDPAFTFGRNLRVGSTALFVSGVNDPPETGVQWLAKVNASTLAVISSTTFAGPPTTLLPNNIGLTSAHVWVGQRGNPTGIVRRFAQSDLTLAEVPTGILDLCRSVEDEAQFVWALFDNGRAVRLDSFNATFDKRIYALGSSYHHRIVSGAPYLYGSVGLQAPSKLVRYNIPAGCSDTTPPLVALFKPEYGTFMQGNFAFTSNSIDNVAVRRIQYTYRSGIFIAESTVAPFSVTADTTQIPDGYYDFTAVAYDECNSTISQSNRAAVANAGIPGVTQALWKIGGTGEADNGTITAIAVDQSSGQIAITGRFTRTVNFGGGNRVSNGDNDIFVAKYSSTGTWLWDHTFGSGVGSQLGQQGLAITIDSSGNIIVGGSFAGTINMDPNLIDAPMSATADSQDIFLAKYNSAGTFIWQKRFGGSGGEASGGGGMGIRTDSSDNIYLTSNFGFFGDHKINFGSGEMTSVSQADIFLVKLTSAGAYGGWQKQIGSASLNNARALAIHGTRLAICGQIKGEANFGGGNAGWQGGSDGFVAVYSIADGSHIWSRVFGDSSDQVAHGIDFDSNGNVAICGDFYGTINLGGGDFVAPSGGAVFFAKYNTSGGLIWGKKFGNDPLLAIASRSVTFDDDDNIIFTGSVIAGVDFGFGNLTSSGYQNTYIVKFDSGSDGNCLWAKRGNDPGGQGVALATDASENLFAAGTFQTFASFGGNGGTVEDTGGQASYIVKIAK